MRPRIRTVKPEALTDIELWDAEQETGLPLFRAFIGLWCCADREGRIEDKAELKLHCLPWWDGKFEDVLVALTDGDFITRYSVNNRFYIHVRTFLQHQVINQRESQSVLPAPGDTAATHVHARADTCVSSARNVPSKLRATVYDRDGQRCARCGATEKLSIDHIFPQSMGGNHAPSNLRTLCIPCNSARPTHGQALIDDLARDGITFADMPRMCMHVQTRARTDDATFPSLPFPSPSSSPSGSVPLPVPAEPPVRLAHRPISETLVSATLDELRPGPGSLPPSSPQDSVSSQVRPVTPPVESNPVSEAPKRNAPRSLADALVIPLAERSKWVEANSHAAEWVTPQQWPELVSVATALHSAAGLAPPRLGAYARDSGVRALVGLFAAGYGVDELLAIIPQLVESDWWRANRRGLSALTPEVIRRASAPPPPKQHLTQADAILQRQLDRVAMLEAKEAAEKRMLT